MTQAELWEWMMDGNYPKGWPKTPKEERRATAKLTRDITVKRWRGHGVPDKTEVWPAGKIVKVVMASRFGDVGITDDLTTLHGYQHRVACVDDYSEPVEDIILAEITPVS